MHDAQLITGHEMRSTRLCTNNITTTYTNLYKQIKNMKLKT